MNKRLLFLAIVGFSFTASAADDTELVQSVAGVYKVNRKIQVYNGPGAGQEYTAYDVEEILEIVPYKSGKAYVRIEDTADNGSRCSFHGIAEVKNSQELEYREDNSPQSCELHIKLDNSRLVFMDPDYNCKNRLCGAHNVLGGYERYDDYGFTTEKKRPIKYMTRLLNSDQYKAAVEAYEHPGAAAPCDWCAPLNTKY